MVDMDMINEVASVWLFLDGVASSCLDTMCIPIRTIDLQKGVLKCGVITSIFKFKNPNRPSYRRFRIIRDHPGRHLLAWKL